MEESSLLEALEALRADGYGTDYGVSAAGQVLCGGCGHGHDPSEVLIERTFRFEGDSNPDDESVLYALRCRRCDQRGVLVAAYGPSASAEEAAVVTALAHR